MVSEGVPRFVKWAGGKGQLLEQLEPLFPKKIDTYIEPFVGGGAVLFYVIKKHAPKEVIIVDVNEELMNAYEVVKNNVDELISKLKEHKSKHDKEYYYKVRAISPKNLNKVERAARFIYLNRTCFNGLYRVNSKGEFNVPMGSYKNPDVVQEDKLRIVSELLKNVKILCGSFESSLEIAKKGDFVYFDPPYYPLDDKPSFTTYHHDEFLDKEHENLAKVFDELSKRGCLCMESNSDTNFVKNLYKKYSMKTVMAKRLINCRAEGRGVIKEVVIMNY
ncbi:MAG: DNA adenine methylase [Candidatus Nanoarchaeia archaeon]